MLDWALYRDNFSTPGMRRIWSESATIAAWLKVEKTLAWCQSDLGLVPVEAADRLGQISSEDLDPAALIADMNTVGRPIVGLVRQLRALVGPEHAPYVHFQSTTQDAMDTALALQM